MDAAGQVAQLDERLLRFSMGFGHEGAGGVGIGVELVLGPAQVHGQRHQPLLCAVVEIPLDPLTVDLDRVDDAGPALGELGDPFVELLGATGTEQRPREEPVEHGRSPDDDRHEREQDQAEAERRPCRDPAASGDVRPDPDLVIREGPDRERERDEGQRHAPADDRDDEGGDAGR